MIMNKIDPSLNEIDQLLYNTCMPLFRKGYLEIGPNKVCLPIKYESFYDRIENFQVRSDDIFVITHPKTGTTWTQEMVWLINNDIDYEKAKAKINQRFPFLEVSTLFDLPDNSDEVSDSVKIVEQLQSPRFIKSHLPWELLPKQLRENSNNKIVYVARNPKDTCVSYYHHYKRSEGFNGNFEEFCELFLANRISYNPFYTHVLEFWNRRNQDNILFLFYEDMKMDLFKVLNRTCEFFGKSFNETQMKQLENHLQFESMKNNPAVNYDKIPDKNSDLKHIHEDSKFMRSGIVGRYKIEMNDYMIAKFDRWTRHNFQGTDIKFCD